MGQYTVVVNTDDLKRSDEAIKIEFVERRDRLKSLGLPVPETPEAMLADEAHAFIAGLVVARFTSKRLDRLRDALPTLTDEQITNMGKAGGIDLDIDVPDITVKP